MPRSLPLHGRKQKGPPDAGVTQLADGTTAPRSNMLNTTDFGLANWSQPTGACREGVDSIANVSTERGQSHKNYPFSP